MTSVTASAPVVASAEATGLDPKAFRQALGRFPTGVTIITCRAPNGEAIGMTASSFNSVSLDPALVLWSIDKRSFSRDAFVNAEYFAIHVLSEQQQELSNRFARQGEDKFADLAVQTGPGETPLLSEYCSRFVCKSYQQVDAGDHIILLGQVIDMDTQQDVPLVFHGGRYAQLQA